MYYFNSYPNSVSAHIFVDSVHTVGCTSPHLKLQSKIQNSKFLNKVKILAVDTPCEMVIDDDVTFRVALLLCNHVGCFYLNDLQAQNYE